MNFNKKSLFHDIVTKSKYRFWEIDSLRGIAVVVMIIFHMLYDSNYFNLYKIELYSLPLFLIFIPFAIIFLLLVGISLTLSYSRASKILTKKQLWLKYLIRGLKIFGLGLIITFVTWIYLGEGFIIFGVLHCIGTSIILAYPFLQLRYQNLILGVVLIFIGIILKNFTFDFYWLVWLGFTPAQFYTIDYFPLLPWFGVVLVGVFLGNIFYPNFVRSFSIPDLSKYRPISFICLLGRNSLLIYFLHQPVLILILYFLFLK